MKRRINASSFDSTGRTLDLTGLLNEKETQIVELEKKIQNLEDRLRRASKREGELDCLLYTSPSPRDLSTSRMPSSA